MRADDDIELLHQDPHEVTVSDVNRLYLEKDNDELLERVLGVPALAGSQQKYFEKRRRRG